MVPQSKALLVEYEEPKPRIYSVSEVTSDVKSILESAFDSLWVEGEISNLKIPSSQHAYFILKDEKSQIRCVLFKGFRTGLQFEPEDGDQDCQHPKRKNFVYDQKIDRFSALVIYLGLLAISENIELKSHRGEEFIFQKSDFLKPNESKLFKKLDGMSSEIKSLSSKLQEYCNEDKPNIDSLQKILEP